MNKNHKLPMPRLPFFVAISKGSEPEKNEPRGLNKLIICLVFNIFAMVLLLGTCGSAINLSEDSDDLNLSSDMEQFTARPDNGKPLIKPQILDESYWSRVCNLNLRDIKLGRFPWNSRFGTRNERCASFAYEKTSDD